MKKDKSFRRCPRCNEKNYILLKKCENCGLIFSRLEYASNKKAKACIRAHKKNEVIYSKEPPKDVSRLKLCLLSGLCGFLGIHNIYIGRYVKGFFSLFFSLLTCILISVMAGTDFASLYENWLFIPGGIVFLLWFTDFFLIMFKLYKIPIALDMEGEYAKK